jgi:hypothetical protein
MDHRKCEHVGMRAATTSGAKKTKLAREDLVDAGERYLVA